MLQLIDFLKTNRNAILFLLLEFIALIFVFRNHSFHYSKYLNSSNYISGSIHNKTHSISEYFNLKSHNKTLAEENVQLKNKLEKYIENSRNSEATPIDSTTKYQHITATVVNNSYSKRSNILTINKGTLDGVFPNMGVVLSNGIVGITLNSNKRYTTVLSVLNDQAKFNVKLKKSHHYGSLEWSGENSREIGLVDFPIQANIKVGDTIISGGKSILFPERIPVGIVSEVEKENNAYKKVIVTPFIDYSSLHTVYIVENFDAEEQINVENQHE